jgi:glutaredoxin 3
MYSTPYCGYCVAAKHLLESRGIPFDEIDVTGDTAKREWLRNVTGRRTVPQIFIGGQSIGGYTELAALDRSGKLATMIQEARRRAG